MTVDFSEALPILTPDGEFLARYSATGLCGLEFPTGAHRSHRDGPGAELTPEISRWHTATVKALSDALAGRVSGDLPPLDLSGGTDFQQRVWRALRKISFGETLSYSEVARAIGQPKAVRAVGGACGANPIPIFVPCHRVLAANHRLGGFGGGLSWKRKLLEREGVRLGTPDLAAWS